MKYIGFDDEITSTNILALIKEITDNTTIYFSSVGGQVDAQEIFIHFTENCEHEIIIVVPLEIASCAVDLFLFSKTKKVVLDGAYALIHTLSRRIETRDSQNPDELTKFYIADVFRGNAKRFGKYTELGLPNELYTKYEQGKDVVINPVMLKEMAEKAEKKYYYGEEI